MKASLILDGSDLPAMAGHVNQTAVDHLKSVLFHAF
jgi:hypothetical protein